LSSCSVAVTVLVNLFVTSPLMTVLSDALEGYIRNTILADLRILEPIFREYYEEVIGKEASSKPGG
jgi:hypothetical protein